MSAMVPDPIWSLQMLTVLKVGFHVRVEMASFDVKLL